MATCPIARNKHAMLKLTSVSNHNHPILIRFHLYKKDDFGPVFFNYLFQGINFPVVPNLPAIPTQEIYCVRWGCPATSTDPNYDAKNMMKFSVSSLSLCFFPCSSSFTSSYDWLDIFLFGPSFSSTSPSLSVFDLVILVQVPLG